MKLRKHLIHVLAILSLGLLSSTVNASLMIKPSRVVLDEKTRSAEVTLLNNSDSVKEYHIEWQQKRQTINGTYIDISEESNKYPASGFIRHSPRKVTIEPGKYQRIKLRLKLPRDIEPGEYRSHLLMRVVNDISVDDFKSNGDPQKGQKINIVPLLSFSIPIMVRVGSVDMKTDITSISVGDNSKGNKELTVNISHDGLYSSVGNLYTYMKIGEGKVTKIGEKHNIALFRETKNRITKIPLRVPDIPKGAVVQVLYQGEDEFEGQILGKAAIRY